MAFAAGKPKEENSISFWGVNIGRYKPFARKVYTF